jgi:hypothetical protein
MIMNDEKPDQAELLLPDGWFAWRNGVDEWHARPPGTPNPRTYVHGDSRQAVADKAWEAHRRATPRKRGTS